MFAQSMRTETMNSFLSILEWDRFPQRAVFRTDENVSVVRPKTGLLIQANRINKKGKKVK